MAGFLRDAAGLADFFAGRGPAEVFGADVAVAAWVLASPVVGSTATSSCSAAASGLTGAIGCAMVLRGVEVRAAAVVVGFAVDLAAAVDVAPVDLVAVGFLAAVVDFVAADFAAVGFFAPVDFVAVGFVAVVVGFLAVGFLVAVVVVADFAAVDFLAAVAVDFAPVDPDCADFAVALLAGVFGFVSVPCLALGSSTGRAESRAGASSCAGVPPEAGSRAFSTHQTYQ